MSEYIYRIHYDKPITPTATTTNSTDLQEKIRELLRQLGATPLSARNATTTEKIEAIRLDNSEPLSLPANMTEVTVPDNLKMPVQNETLLLKAVNESELLVTVTDASLQATQCDQIVLDMAKRLYVKGTGEEASDEEIEIERVGVLARTICQYCRSTVGGLPYRCPHCGRTYCRSHVAPVSHQCSVTISEHTGQTKTSLTHETEIQSQVRPHQPRITIGRVPCG